MLVSRENSEQAQRDGWQHKQACKVKQAASSVECCSPMGSGVAGSPWRGKVVATVCGVGRQAGARGSMAGVVILGGEDTARWCSKAPAQREAPGRRWHGDDVM
jgi:hypothetical protein